MDPFRDKILNINKQEDHLYNELKKLYYMKNDTIQRVKERHLIKPLRFLNGVNMQNDPRYTKSASVHQSIKQIDDYMVQRKKQQQYDLEQQRIYELKQRRNRYQGEKGESAFKKEFTFKEKQGRSYSEREKQQHYYQKMKLVKGYDFEMQNYSNIFGHKQMVERKKHIQEINEVFNF